MATYNAQCVVAATKTFTLSSKNLESGTIVKAMETTDNIYLSGSATLSGLNITVGGGLYVETIFDLYDTNVYSGTIVYNTNSIANIIYTNCIVNKVNVETALKENSSLCLPVVKNDRNQFINLLYCFFIF